MLKQRVATAVVLIVAFVGTLFFAAPPIFCMVTEIITLLAVWEWTALMGLRQSYHRALYLCLLLLLMQAVFFIPVPINYCVYLFYATFLFWVLMIPLVAFYPRVLFWKKSIFVQGLMGIFVMVPSWFAINFIRDVDAHGQYLLLYLFLLIWGADIAGFFVGRRYGVRKLAPKVSPSKSWAGVYGGLVVALLITMVPLYWFQVPYSFWPYTLGLSLITVLFSVVGDLFESMFKRSEGLKDSGSLLPGHGGLLDRIDSLTAAAPVFTLGAIILSRMSA